MITKNENKPEYLHVGTITVNIYEYAREIKRGRLVASYELNDSFAQQDCCKKDSIRWIQRARIELLPRKEDKERKKDKEELRKIGILPEEDRAVIDPRKDQPTGLGEQKGDDRPFYEVTYKDLTTLEELSNKVADAPNPTEKSKAEKVLADAIVEDGKTMYDAPGLLLERAPFSITLETLLVCAKEKEMAILGGFQWGFTIKEGDERLTPISLSRLSDKEKFRKKFNDALMIAFKGWSIKPISDFCPKLKNTPFVNVVMEVTDEPPNRDEGGEEGGEEVGEEDFSLQADPVNLEMEIPQGGSGATTIAVIPSNDFSDDVEFSLSGAPAGVSHSFNPGTTPTGRSLNLSVASNAVPGDYKLTVIGVSGSLRRTVPVLLTIPQAVPPVSFTIDSTEINAGEPATVTLRLNAPAPQGGIVVNLTSSNPAVATVPATVEIAAGEMEAAFSISTNPVSMNTVVAIMANDGVTQPMAALTVLSTGSGYGYGDAYGVEGIELNEDIELNSDLNASLLSLLTEEIEGSAQDR